MRGKKNVAAVVQRVNIPRRQQTQQRPQPQKQKLPHPQQNALTRHLPNQLDARLPSKELTSTMYMKIARIQITAEPHSIRQSASS